MADIYLPTTVGNALTSSDFNALTATQNNIQYNINAAALDKNDDGRLDLSQFNFVGANGDRTYSLTTEINRDATHASNIKTYTLTDTSNNNNHKIGSYNYDTTTKEFLLASGQNNASIQTGTEIINTTINVDPNNFDANMDQVSDVDLDRDGFIDGDSISQNGIALDDGTFITLGTSNFDIHRFDPTSKETVFSLHDWMYGGLIGEAASSSLKRPSDVLQVSIGPGADSKASFKKLYYSDDNVIAPPPAAKKLNPWEKIFSEIIKGL